MFFRCLITKPILFPLIWNHIFLSFIGYKFIISDHISPYYPYICHIMPWYFMHFHGSQKVSPYVFVMFSWCFRSVHGHHLRLRGGREAFVDLHLADGLLDGLTDLESGRRDAGGHQGPGMTRAWRWGPWGPMGAHGGPWISWVIPTGYD